MGHTIGDVQFEFTVAFVHSNLFSLIQTVERKPLYCVEWAGFQAILMGIWNKQLSPTY